MAPDLAMMDAGRVDYSLYLVTDSTPAILGGRDLCWVVDEALKGGVTCVQYREKTSDTGHMIAVASKLHDITKRHNVPLLINDRIDVALAVGCEGVHIGQDDMGKNRVLLFFFFFFSFFSSCTCSKPLVVPPFLLFVCLGCVCVYVCLYD
jgi:hypothetical protein